MHKTHNKLSNNLGVAKHRKNKIVKMGLRKICYDMTKLKMCRIQLNSEYSLKNFRVANHLGTTP